MHPVNIFFQKKLLITLLVGLKICQLYFLQKGNFPHKTVLGLTSKAPVLELW